MTCEKSIKDLHFTCYIFAVSFCSLNFGVNYEKSHSYINLWQVYNIYHLPNNMDNPSNLIYLWAVFTAVKIPRYEKATTDTYLWAVSAAVKIPRYEKATTNIYLWAVLLL